MSKNALEISEIRVRVNPRDAGGTGPVAGWASFVVNDGLYLNNVTIRRHAGGRLGLEYPSTATPTGRHTHFKPINREAADLIEAAVFLAFHTEDHR